MFISRIISAVLLIVSISSITYSQQFDRELRILAPYSEEGTLKPTDVLTNQEKSPGCTGASEGTIGLVDCDDVGTATFGTAGMFDAMDSEAGVTAPSPFPPCGPGLGNGSWHRYDLAAGVEQVMIDYSGGFTSAGGFSSLWMSFYQGPDCASLTNVGCGQIIDKSGPTLVLLDLSASGLNDAQDLWVFTWGNKAYTIDFTFTGLPAAPANDDCASAATSTTGCNLGAEGASFTAPSNILGAGACDGGTWYSNENTVFYTFTASAASGSLEIIGLTCNDGVAGEAQIGVWTNCASLGTYGANYLGCAVGTGTVSMPSLTIGNSYVIAVDGQAGDACKWEFSATGILLPVELISLNVEQTQSGNRIYWSTASEQNSDYFEIERSDDGVIFYPVGKMQAAGFSNDLIEYDGYDRSPMSATIYYRLKQVDMDGKVEYHGPKALSPDQVAEVYVSPNPSEDFTTVHFNHMGGKIYSYEVKDVTGRIILKDYFIPGSKFDSLTIDTENLIKGMYFVVISGGSNEVYNVNFYKK